MKRTLLLVACLVLTVTAIGCNTIKGVGQDLSAVGGWVSEGSDNVNKN